MAEQKNPFLITEEQYKKNLEMYNSLIDLYNNKLIDKSAFDDFLQKFNDAENAINNLNEKIEKTKKIFKDLSDTDIIKIGDIHEKIKGLETSLKNADNLQKSLEKKRNKAKTQDEKDEYDKQLVELAEQRAKSESTILKLKTQIGVISGKDYDTVKKKLNLLDKEVSNTNSICSDTQKLGENLQQNTKEYQRQVEEAKRLREEHDKMAEMPVKFLKGLSNIPNAIGNIYGQLKDIAKPWLDSDHAVHQMVKTFGLHGTQFEIYKKNMYDVSVNMSKWGKTMEDLVKTQQQYNQATGRNVQLSENAFNEQYKLNQVIGEEDGSQLTANLELFGQSVETSVDLYEDMYKTAIKMGISTTKSTKDMLKNLKLAQKYNFNGGLKNMMEMTVWANKTRFNMDSLGSIIDKFSDNFEDTISSAAQIQNLGGNFAMGADPLGMFYESLADPDALTKRLNGMLKGMGSFDTKTGETKFNINEAMLMRQFAKASGQSVEDVRTQAMEGRKRDYIQNNLISNTSGLTQEQIDLIGSKAQAKGNGEFVVTDNAGREINVRDINSSNIGTISTDTSEKDFLSRIAEQSRSANDKMVAIESLLRNQQAQYMEQYGNKIHSWLGGLYDFLQKNDWVAQMIPWFKLTGTIAGILGSILEAIKGLRNITDLLGNLGGKGKGKKARGRGKKGKSTSTPSANPNNGTPSSGGNTQPKKGFWDKLKGVGKGIGKWGGKALKRIPVLGSLAAGGFEVYQAIQEYNEELKKWEEARDNGQITEEQFNKAVEQLKQNRKAQLWKAGMGAAVGGALGLIPGVGGFVGSIAGEWVGRKAGDLISGGESNINLNEAIYKNQNGYNNVPVINNRELGIEQFNVPPQQVEPVNDGISTPRLIKPANDDNILFAKDGGPFDSLFNNVFKKIDDVHRIVASPSITNRNSISKAVQNVSTLNGDTIHTNNKNVLNRIKNVSNAVVPSDSRNDSHILSVQPVGNGNGITSNGVMDNISNDISRINNASNNSINNNKISFEPLKIELSGNLTLSSGNQTVDLTSIIRDNPMFIRQLSQMLSEEIGNRINGGRSLMNKSYV